MRPVSIQKRLVPSCMTTNQFIFLFFVFAFSVSILVSRHLYRTDHSYVTFKNYYDSPVNSSRQDTIRASYSIFQLPFMKLEIINPFPYEFTINPKENACERQSVDFLLAVPVSRSNFEERQVVRETWGSFAINSTSWTNRSTLLLFFLGSESWTESPDVQQRIDKESQVYGDIVQSEFVDSYRNLSLKSISILKWVDQFCNRVEFVVKADDDMYVAVPRLVANLNEKRVSHPKEPFVVGRAIIGAKPVTDKKSKWYTPKEMFSESRYPRYTTGTTYSMTGSAARIMYQAAIRTSLFWLEDVYITGLCTRTGRVLVINDNGYTYGKPKSHGCSFKKDYITGHRYTKTEIRKIHKEFIDTNLICGDKL